MSCDRDCGLVETNTHTDSYCEPLDTHLANCLLLVYLFCRVLPSTVKMTNKINKKSLKKKKRWGREVSLLLIFSWNSCPHSSDFVRGISAVDYLRCSSVNTESLLEELWHQRLQRLPWIAAHSYTLRIFKTSFSRCVIICNVTLINVNTWLDWILEESSFKLNIPYRCSKASVNNCQLIMLIFQPQSKHERANKGVPRYLHTVALRHACSNLSTAAY